jgi:hypothetical protein
MAFRSRTGKLMQGLFGRFGRKNLQQSEVSPAKPRYQRTRSQTEIDEREFPSANRFDDDEETNWDDVEELGDKNNPIPYTQPIVPVVAPSPVSTIMPDVEDWDEALPAATVKNSNIQEARRGKNPAPMQTEDMWEDDLPSRTFSTNNSPKLNSPAKPRPMEQFFGLWGAMLQQFRRLLPAPIRRLSDAILTVGLVIVVTVGIWVVDGLFAPSVNPSVASKPAPPVVGQPKIAPTLAVPQGSPEQDFIEAIQSQLSDITSQYSDDIIQTLRVDIAQDRLVVQLNPIWYLISDDRQNSVTDKMWLQAKANHFRKLEIQDAQGVSIARSPVVGNHPIILQRRQSF